MYKFFVFIARTFGLQIFAFSLFASDQSSNELKMSVEISSDQEVEVSRKVDVQFADLVKLQTKSELDSKLAENIVEVLENGKVWSHTNLVVETEIPGAELTKLISLVFEKNKHLKMLRPTFNFPKIIKIRRASENRNSGLSLAELERRIALKFFSICAHCETRVEINKIPKWNFKNWKYDLSNLELKANNLIPIRNNDSESSGESQSQLWINVRNQIKDQVVVAKQNLGFNEIVQERDLAIQYEDITLKKNFFHQIDEVKGLKLKKSIRVGEVLIKDYVQSVPLVNRQSNVQVVIGDENFEISTELLSEQDGNKGDRIRLKNVATGKTFVGEVVDKNKVRIQ